MEPERTSENLMAENVVESEIIGKKMTLGNIGKLVKIIFKFYVIYILWRWKWESLGSGAQVEVKINVNLNYFWSPRYVESWKHGNRRDSESNILTPL